MLTRRKFLPIVIGLVTATPAFAQPSSRPITIIVPFAVGGAADVVARAAGQGVTEALKQNVIIENKGGAAGLIGASAVARAAPDGHTLFLATDGIFSNPALANPSAQETLGKLVPVASIAEAPLALAVSASFPANTVAELVEVAKKRSTPLTYGTSGIGTAHHLAGELLARSGGVKMAAVPYRGTSAGANDLVAGTLDILIGNLASIQPIVATGKAKLIAVTSAQPFKLAPTVPTVAQTYKDFEMMVNFGLMAPAGTPPAVIARLSAAVEKALTMREVRNQIYGAGLAPTFLTSEAYGKLLKNTTAVRSRLIAEANIKPE